MNGFWSDLRHAARVLRRAPGFTAVAVLLLGLGIGATTTLFGAVNGVLRRPLPYAEPHRLVALWETNPAQHAERSGVSAPNFVDWRAMTRTLGELAAYRPWGFVLTGGCAPGACEPERVQGARVSANLFAMLGVRQLAGRAFLAGEDEPGRQHVALLSEALWRRRFAADPALVGRTVELDGAPYTVVGVVPAGFDLPEAELWVPLAFAPYELAQRGTRALSVVGRLKPATTLAAAREDLRGVARTLRQRYPDADAGWEVGVAGLQEDLVGDTRATLLLLFGATATVLLVACANLANLILARSAGRRREMAVRAALGAGRGRLVRQLAAESALVVAAGAALGLTLALAGTRLLAGLGPQLLPRAGEVRVDAAVLGFALLVALVTSLALAIGPALEAARLDLSAAMKAGAARPARSVGARPARSVGVGARDLLVVGQVALALFLLVGAGLLVRSFARAQAVELGFAPGGVLSMTVSLPGGRYQSEQQRAAFFDDLARRVEALPGVRSAGLASHLPLATNLLRSDFVPEGSAAAAGGETQSALLSDVSPGYFRTLGIRLVRGRTFAESDRLGSPRVVVVDETLARRYWPDGDAVGRRMRVGAAMGADTGWREVVGVVASVRSTSVVRGPEPTIYVPLAQNPWPTMGLVVRTTGDPLASAAAVRAAVLALDPAQPVYNVRSLEQVVGRTLAARRFQTLLLGAFAATTLLLAVVGVYGLLAYVVAQRTRELGIRLALGAQRRDVLGSVVGQALARIGAGLILGGLAAVTGSRLLTSVLFEVSPWDPATFAGATLLLAGAGLVASWLPARRAARLDPVLALRRE